MPVGGDCNCGDVGIGKGEDRVVGGVIPIGGNDEVGVDVVLLLDSEGVGNAEGLAFPSVGASDVDAAIGALNLQATKVEEYVVQPAPVAGRMGVFCSVDSAAFRVEHLRPGPDDSVEIPDELPHCLLAIRGSARIVARDNRIIGDLRQGESAVVPIGVRGYRVESATDDTEIIKASFPSDA